MIEEILKWLGGEDILSLAAASETVRGVVEAGFKQFQHLFENFEFVCLRQQISGAVQQRRVTTSRLLFASTLAQKTAALLKIIKFAQKDASDQPLHTCRLLIIVSSTSEAEVASRVVKAAGVKCKTLFGYPTRDFRERYWFNKREFTRPGLIAVVVTHSRGEWETWPDHVIAFNSPKSIKDHIQVEMIGGRTTWTLLTMAKEEVKIAQNLSLALKQYHPDTVGPGMAAPKKAVSFWDIPIWDILTTNRMALVRKAYASLGRNSARNWAR